MTARRELRAGENADLAGSSVQVQLEPAAPGWVVPLAGDDTAAGPVGAFAGAVQLRLAELAAHVVRVLIVVKPVAGQEVPPAGGLQATVLAGSAPDTALTFRPPEPPLPATELLELYRRGAAWKVRALGQGYAGGAREFAERYRLELPGGTAAEPSASTGGAAAPGFGPGSMATGQRAAQGREAGSPPRPSAPSPPPPPAGPTPSGPTPAGPADLLSAVRACSGIWRDAAHSTSAYIDAVAYAERRRDTEIEELLADPAARAPDHPARRAAESRCQQLVDTASARRLGDLDQLTAELRALEEQLPPAAARWDAAVWQRPLPADGGMVIRIGEFTRPDSQALRIPVLHPLLVPGGLLLDRQATEPAAPAVVSALQRICAAVPAGREVRVIGADPTLLAALQLSSAAGTEHRENELAGLAMALDLWSMARSGGVADGTVELEGLPAVVVLPWPGPGEVSGEPSTAELDALRIIAERGPEAGLGLVLVAALNEPAGWAQVLDPAPVPLVAARVRDSWTGQYWEFVPDAGGPSPQLGEQLRARLSRQHD